jgi:radical SAM superfamily enzyme YgiQ (UPF0313 family)
VWIGSESGSQRILDAMDRRVKAETVQGATRLLRSKGIEVGFFIMVGYEGEEHEDLLATVEHIRKSDPDIVLTTTAYPIRGTEYANDVADRAVNDKPWAIASDRETLVRGRRSKRYYVAVRSWIENDFAAHRLWSKGRKAAAARPAILALWARIRMRWRSGERVA